MTPVRPTPEDLLVVTSEPTPLRTLGADLWRHRNLFRVLAKRSFYARYRSAKLGVLWSVFLPLIQGAVLAYIFSHVVRVQLPYNFPIYVLSGMVGWTYFNSSLAAASTSIIDDAVMTTKIYYPRLIPPSLPALAGIPGYLISVVIILGLMVLFGVPLTVNLLLLPVAATLLVLLTILLSAFTAMLYVYFRDVRYLVQALLLVWFYGTPVFYSITMTGSVRPLVVANPMTGVLQLTRFAIFGEATAVGESLLWAVGAIVVLLVVVAGVYRRHDRIAVDRL
jgi:ABC-type polysaccharide/polyol phosphate export permease